MNRNPAFLAVLILALLSLFSAGCYYDNEEDLYGDVNTQVCDTTDLIYNDGIERIIEAHCATSGCHVAGGSGIGIFDSYDGVKAKVDDGSLIRRVVDRKDMPPSPNPPLTDCQINQIANWVADGAPEN